MKMYEVLSSNGDRDGLYFELADAHAHTRPDQRVQEIGGVCVYCGGDATIISFLFEPFCDKCYFGGMP